MTNHDDKDDKDSQVSILAGPSPKVHIMQT